MIRAIVTDIEGTTSSIRFVHDVLFPYARARMAEFVATHAELPEVREQLAAVGAEVGQALTDEQAVEVLLQWIDEDRKITPLKALQGMIWQQGYQQGDFKGHVYADAYACLLDWQAQGIRLYVYSSGSVPAQQLLFGYSEFGDMTPFFTGYFDTRIGAKREADAYRRILEAIALPAAEVLFLSDISQELDAADEAGMHTCQLLRDGETVVAPNHPQARTFNDIVLA